mmetsp:Transcript_23704/g.36384  ORF Transcript_23704/g.36384 Transcript_23704/m.36384 type:complete len:91 (+) Transcript_23704:725-997(+)
MKPEKTEARKKKWDSLFSNNSQHFIKHQALTPVVQPLPLTGGASSYMMFAPKSKGMVLHLKNHLKKGKKHNEDLHPVQSNFLRMKSPMKD